MNHNEYTASLFVHEDGTLAVHGGDIRGLVIEVDNVAELREELLRVAPELLRSNHGLSDEEIAQASIRLVFHDTEAHVASPDSKPHTAVRPRLLWEDDPRITACA